jgi:hypothetical protein
VNCGAVYEACVPAVTVTVFVNVPVCVVMPVTTVLSDVVTELTIVPVEIAPTASNVTSVAVTEPTTVAPDSAMLCAVTVDTELIPVIVSVELTETLVNADVVFGVIPDNNVAVDAADTVLRTAVELGVIPDNTDVVVDVMVCNVLGVNDIVRHPLAQEAESEATEPPVAVADFKTVCLFSVIEVIADCVVLVKVLIAVSVAVVIEVTNDVEADVIVFATVCDFVDTFEAVISVFVNDPTTEVVDDDTLEAVFETFPTDVTAEPVPTDATCFIDDVCVVAPVTTEPVDVDTCVGVFAVKLPGLYETVSTTSTSKASFDEALIPWSCACNKYKYPSVFDILLTAMMTIVSGAIPIVCIPERLYTVVSSLIL